jgi:UDP-N-acetylmuramoyl-tripeptide--D-alanyl-D-alanine ligase
MMTKPSDHLWTGADVLKALQPVSASGGTDWAASGVSIDTRTMQKGDLFLALSGENFDAHSYLRTAFDNGAIAAIVERGNAQLEAFKRASTNSVDPDRLIEVDHVPAALEALAIFARARTRSKVIAVTGSVGKTSVKESLKKLLAVSGSTHAAEKSFNNHIGVPLTLARMPEGVDFSIFEIGMNHSGEIEPLAKMVRPDVSIITTISPAHIENLGSLEAIAAAKSEIFMGMDAGGYAVLPLTSSFYEQLETAAHARGLQVTSFGSDDRADAHTHKIKLHADCSCVDAFILDQRIAYKIGIPGAHHVENSLATLAVIRLLNADLALAGLELAKVEAIAGRGLRHIVPLGADTSFTLIDESYNANPASISAALETLMNIPCSRPARRIAVLGDMVELGDKSTELHRSLKSHIHPESIDLVFCAGIQMKHLYDALPADQRGGSAENATQLIAQLKAELRDQDIVMVKGSNASGMGRIVDYFIDAEPLAQKIGA